MAVVHNYFELIPIPDPENPSQESTKHVQSPKELKGKNVDSLRRRRLGYVFFSDFVFFLN
jgi:hypothetical protein